MSGPVAKLWRDGQMVMVEGAPPKLLAMLRTWRLETAAGGPHGYSTARKQKPLFDTFGGIRGDPLVLEVWAGLEPVVRRLLSRWGCVVKTIPTDPADAAAPLPEPNLAAPKKSKAVGGDVCWLNFLRARERGLAVIDPSRYPPAALIAQAAVAFPGAKITVLVSRLDDGYALRRSLRRHVPDVEFFHGRHHPEAQPRVAIASYDYADYPPVSLDQRDIIFALDAREATSEKAREQLARACRARMFGFLPLDGKASRYESDWVRAVFGFAEIRLPSPGHRERQVRVVRCVADGGLELPPDARPSTIQRALVWDNAGRNGLIASVAMQMQKGQKARGVLVLVDNVRHLLALAELLPGWALCPDRSGPNVLGLTPEQIKLLEERDLGWDAESRFTIATWRGLEALNLDGIDVVVRADARDGLPAALGEKLAEPADSPGRPLMLVDVDDHHPHLRRQSAWRRRAHERRGWFAAGTDPVEARVGRFLAGRRRP